MTDIAIGGEGEASGGKTREKSRRDLFVYTLFLNKMALSWQPTFVLVGKCKSFVHLSGKCSEEKPHNWDFLQQ